MSGKLLVTSGNLLQMGVFTELCLPYIFLEKIYTCLLGYFH